MIKLTLGTILIIIGLSLFSPLEEAFIVLPLSYIFGAWLIGAWTAFAVICLAIGVYLVGRSKYIPNPIARHIWAFTAIAISLCIYFIYLTW